jgi:hypothetical protein
VAQQPVSLAGRHGPPALDRRPCGCIAKRMSCGMSKLPSSSAISLTGVQWSSTLT